MVQVPVYQQTERLRPIFQQGVDVRATPDAFGADVGRGMQQLAQGGLQAADAMQQVKELQAGLSAKDSLTALERAKMELDYGPNGYLTTQGKNAVEGRQGYNEALEALKKQYVPKDPMAARKFNDAATSAVTQGMKTAIVHSAQGQKDWAASSSTARMELFKDQALSGYDKPGEIGKALALGNAEIDEQSKLMGWDASVIEYKRKEFSSQVHTNVALAMASKPNGARAALDYVTKNADGMDPKTKIDIETKLKPFAVDEQGLSIVNGIMGKRRETVSPTTKVSDLPGDMVAEVAAAARPATGGGPTKSKAFLASRSAHADRPGDTTNLDNDFADNLAAMIQDAPPGIREGLGLTSGWRSNERQSQLFAASDRTGRTVAFPAGMTKPDGTVAKGSNHLHGRAADLSYNGKRLDQAPQEVRDWVHSNAANYGLRFPMSWEAWHIEPTKGGTQVVASHDGVSTRAQLPSFGDAMAEIDKISDPQVRASAMKQLNAQFELRSKAESNNAAAAKSQIWEMQLRGTPMSQVPLDLKIAAGREAVEGFNDYERKGGNVVTDPIAYSKLTEFAATNPAGFSKLDLTAPEIINSLSREDWKSLSDKKSSALGDQRKAVEDGTMMTGAFKMADDQLEAVGITTTGKKDAEREAAAKRIAQFRNQLAQQIEDFRRENKNRAPTFDEQRSMINRLLLPVVTKQERSMWNPLKTPWSSTSETGGQFMFETGGKVGDLGGGVSAELNIQYKDIPLPDRLAVETALEKSLGFKPSPAQVETAYETYLLERK